MKINATLLAAAILLAGCQTAPQKTTQKPNYPSGNGFLLTAQQMDAAKMSSVSPEDDIWGYIRDEMKMNIPDNDRIRTEELSYLAKKSYLHDVTLRAEPYMYWIIGKIDERNMPMELVLLPIVESAFNPHATSPAQAAGLWQIIPSTGKANGLNQNQWVDDRRDVAASTTAALDLLERLNTMFGGDWALTLAAYNSGEGRVLRAMEANAAAGKPTDYWSLSLPKETMDYVPRIFALSNVIRNSDRNGVNLPVPNAERALARVNIGRQISLDVAAQLLDMPVSRLRDYNPSLKRGVTSPAGPHYLMLPKTKVDQLMSALSDDAVLNDIRTAVAKNNQRTEQLSTPAGRAQAAKYKVKSGDSFYAIANRHKMTVAELKKLNGLKSASVLKPGQTLQVKGSPVVKPSKAAAKNAMRLAKYKVRQGDSYYSIAQRHGVTLKELMSWNSKVKMKDLHPGIELTVYVANKRG
ncbi:murein transglycosylase D [Morganella morganii]|uniref:peptidoglycan lytic exotransglycosylase n=1 Tax=Morganella morganii TaxID=582 RepID=A0A433ZWU7_MORMO|nr:murein transglycosylase D [Morganella morganii]RUT66601.1 murein transglycosylase D [Morganella morganii]